MSNFDLCSNRFGRMCDYNHYGDHSEIRPYNTYAEAKEWFNYHYKKIPEFMKEKIICKTLELNKPENLSIEEQISGLSWNEKVDYLRRCKMEENQDKEFGYKLGESNSFYYSNN